MKKLATILSVAACLVVGENAAMAANTVRISQVYGGGGGTTASTDFVELFNASGVAVNVGGWVIEYGSATGLWNSFTGNAFVIPAGTLIQPCSYLLFAGNVGTGGAPSIGADIATSPTTQFNMSGTTGKVMLVTQLNGDGTAGGAVACGSEVGTIIDKVAWGPTATCFEGAATAALTSSTAAQRNAGGLADTDNNLADFTTGVAPAPRNSHSPGNAACFATPTLRSTWGQLKSIYR